MAWLNMQGESSANYAANYAIDGIVVSGLGRGSEFLSLAWVRSEICQKLGLDPFPGTLNLRISPELWSGLYARRRSFISIADPSSASCPGYLQRVVLLVSGQVYSSAYLILPELTMYKDVLEIIAPESLRQKLGLKDGDRVCLEEIEET
jgi:riboflavin kinase, archaea type